MARPHVHSATNAWLVRIDQTALTLAPLLAGQVMTSMGVWVGAAFIAGWNIVSLAFEYGALYMVYASSPLLSAPRHGHKEATPIANDEHAPLTGRVGRSGRLTKRMHHLTKGWVAYWQSPVLLAAIAMALLYLTVLSTAESTTTGYVFAQGIRENILGVARGMGAIMGILGTFAFPLSRHWFGLNTTGVIALTLELLMLVASLASVWLPGSPYDPAGYFAGTQPQWTNASLNGTQANDCTNKNYGDYTGSQLSVWMLLGGIVAARFGLWMADLAITQIMQENVADADRGAVFGTQYAIQIDATALKDSANNAFAGIANNTSYSFTTVSNQPPTLSSAPSDVTVTEDAASNLDLSAVSFADGEGDSLTVTLAVSAGTME